LTITGIVFDQVLWRISDFGDCIHSDKGFGDPYIPGGSRLAAFAHVIVADINATDDSNITRGVSAPSSMSDQLVSKETSKVDRKVIMDHYLLWRIHYKRMVVEPEMVTWA
jgi:hypothetical protein